MKTKTVLFVLSLLAIGVLLAACGGNEAPAPTQPSQPASVATEVPEEQVPADDSADTPAQVPTLTPSQTVALAEIVNTTWNWVEMIENNPAAQPVVPVPEMYTIALFDNGVYTVRADCKSGQGTYTVNGNQIVLSPFPVTMQICSNESLEPQYLDFLGQVATFGMRDGKLVLGLQSGTGEMRFQEGGGAILSAEAYPNVTGIEMETLAIEFSGPHQFYLVPEIPYDDAQTPPVGLPQHVQAVFDEMLPPELQPGDPVFYIIPMAAYKEMWQNAGDSGVDDTLGLLQIALSEQPLPVPAEGMPVLPNEHAPAYNDLAAQGKYLSFDRGYGVRFVARFNQTPAPVTNEGLFYVFQGFSYDGNYFYAFFYPVTTAALPDTAEDVPEDEMTRFSDDTAAYMAERVQMLNGLSPEDWEINLETLDALVVSLDYFSTFDQPAAAPEPEANPLVDVAWQWTAFSDPAAGETPVADPENYVILFNEDSTFNLIADCNVGSGTYTMDGSALTLKVGQMTRMACGEESLSDRFVGYLGNVATYVFDDSGRLVFNLAADSGNLYFTGGATIEPPAPDEGVPTATALEPINVWAGPGKEYGSYGTVPIGATAEIVGKSADGKYWVVQVSTEIAPDGRGWVIATYVQAENVDNVPVIEAP